LSSGYFIHYRKKGLVCGGGIALHNQPFCPGGSKLRRERVPFPFILPPNNSTERERFQGLLLMGGREEISAFSSHFPHNRNH